MMDRDLIGCGANPPDRHRPGGTRHAATAVPDVGQGSEPRFTDARILRRPDIARHRTATCPIPVADRPGG